MIRNCLARTSYLLALLAAGSHGCQSQPSTEASRGQPAATVAAVAAAPTAVAPVPERPVLASATHDHDAQDVHVTKSLVVDWSRRGVKDDVIVERIGRSREVFRLTAADETQLRDCGVSESVIQAMEDTTRR
jgi:hypothetical protein